MKSFKSLFFSAAVLSGLVGISAQAQSVSLSSNYCNGAPNQSCFISIYTQIWNGQNYALTVQSRNEPGSPEKLMGCHNQSSTDSPNWIFAGDGYTFRLRGPIWGNCDDWTWRNTGVVSQADINGGSQGGGGGGGGGNQHVTVSFTIDKLYEVWVSGNQIVNANDLNGAPGIYNAYVIGSVPFNANIRLANAYSTDGGNIQVQDYRMQGNQLYIRVLEDAAGAHNVTLDFVY